MPPRASAASRRRAAPPPAGRAASPPFALRPGWTALALGVLHLLLTLVALDPAPHTGGDNAAYLGLARALLERGAYVELWDPALRPHTQYPPGFPAILAGAMLLGVKPWAGFKLLVAAFSVAAVALSYLWARRVAGPGIALGVGVLLAIGPGVVVLSQLELSDVPFWTFTLLALWAFAKSEAGESEAGGEGAVGHGDGTGGGDALRWVALGAAATAAAALTRSAGLPLVVAACGWLVLRRRWRALGLFAAVVAPGMIGWSVWQRSMGGGEAYGTQFWYIDPYQPELGRAGAADLVARAAENAWKYTSHHLPALLTGRAEEPLAVALAAAVVALALYGWGRRLRRPGLPELLLPLYGGLVLVWPAEWADDRYLLPVLPLLLVYAGRSLGALAARTPRPRLAAAGAVAFVALCALPLLAGRARRVAECRAAYADGLLFACHPTKWGGLNAFADQLRGALPEGTVVLSRKPTLFWALSGYRSRMYPLSADPEVLLRAARDAGARYLVFDQSGESVRYLLRAVRARREAFCMVPGVRNDYAALVRIGTDGPPLSPDTPPNRYRVCEPGPYAR